MCKFKSSLNKFEINSIDIAIEEAREKMIASIEKYGKLNPKTINLSQKLDRLIVQRMKC